MYDKYVKTSEEYKEKFQKKLDKAYKKTESSLSGFFIKNFRFTYLILLIILIGGVYSIMVMPRESEPEVRVPFAVVTTIYPGANPTDIEDLITNEVEDKIDGLENLKRYTSSSGQGFSSIFVEYNAEADLEDSFRKLREAVDKAEPGLPSDAETPVVTEINFSDYPIVTYSLVGDYTDVELKKFADDLQDNLEGISDVSRAEIIGGLEQEFQVIVSQTKLANFNISLSQIVGAIRASNFSLPAGEIEVDGFKYNVRVKGRVTTADQLNDIVITTFSGSPVFLRDIATITDTFKEQKTESKIGLPGKAAKNTISLQVYKSTGGNILQIVDKSRSMIDKMYANNELPDGLVVQKTNDNSVFIKDDLRTLGTSGIQTFFLITIILLIVLSFRAALITALAVPIAFLMAFIFLNLQGLTLNGMVLFSLVISLGLMVDNAIIIIEGINEYVEIHGRSVYEGAILSVWNFKWPIIAGTMTTVGAFLPMLLVSGIMGEYMSVLPKTISMTLLSSLFVALVVIPTLITRFIKVGYNTPGSSKRNAKRHEFNAKQMQKLYVKYVAFMRNVLPHKKKRRRLIAGAWILFIIALTMPFTGVLRVEMFPKIDIEYFVVNVELPVGSVMEKTKQVTAEAEKIIANIPEMDNYVVNVGASMSFQPGSGGGSGSHLANITVNLLDDGDRERRSYEITDELRPQLEAIQGGKVQVEELNAGPPTGAPVEVRIFGDNIKDLDLLSGEITKILENIEGVINIKDSINNAAGEFTFSVDKQQANYYGLDISTVASTLRNAIYGTTASVVNVGGDDVDITVKYEKEAFTNVSDLENLLLFTRNGNNIPLKQVAKIDLEPSLLSIGHRDGKKIATVTAGIEKGVNLQKVLQEFDMKKQDINLPENFSIEVGGETEDIQRSFTEIFLSLILAIILIALILVLQFNSFKQPLIIIFSLPLALIGVIVGLIITRQAFSLPAFIGIVSLSGIVVNDAIVLIDRINKNIKNGMEYLEAIIEGGVARMQPIFLTSLTTIAGIFPLVYANELWRGLSITVIFGLMFSTMLILIVIPTIYTGLCYKEKCLKENN